MTFRFRIAPLVLAAALACAALAPPARAATPQVLPDPAVLLDAQRAAARRILHASIWEGAREHLDAGREGDARPHARVTNRRAHAPGTHPRAVPPEPGAPPPSRAATTGAQRVLGVPVNVRCNDPTHDGTAATQSECGAAGIGSNLVVNWNNGQGVYISNDIESLGWSNDGGATFTPAAQIVHPAGKPAFRWTGDPVMAVNAKTGDYYVCGLCTPDGFHNGIAVAHGRFVAGAFVMDSAFMVRSVSSTAMFLDKEWIACDSSTGNVYVTNTTFGAEDTVDFYRSTTGGRTWSSPTKLSSNSDAGWVQGSRVVVARGGDVEVAWYAAAQTTVESSLRFRRSTDHGVTFGAQVTPVTFNEQFGTGGPGFNRDWGPNFPSLAVDNTGGPHDGRLYVAWPECWRFGAVPVPVGPPVFDAEPNGSAAVATPFTVGQTLRGTLVTSYYGVFDQDWYSFPLTAGQSVIVFADSVQLGSGWMLRLVAPDGTQRLCRGGQADSSQNVDAANPAQAYYTFTAPVSGTYYLDMYAQSYAPATYEIKTAFGTPGAERGRDQRDAFACWSDDGVTWSTPVRLDDDGPGYDLVYPELAVGSDGAVYATWYDHRDDLYGTRANVYATRSTDGGATWASNQLVSSAQSNFTTTPSYIAPNMGDYNGLTASGGGLVAAWGDTRSGTDVDVWAAAVDLSSALANCPADTAITAGGAATLGGTIVNHDVLFGGGYGVALADARGWPLPGPSVVNVGAGASAPWSAGLAVPDTAANGTDTLTVTLTTPAGRVAATCRVVVTVEGSVLAAAPAARGLALSAPRPNPAAAESRLDFALPRAGHVRLVVYDLAGARVRTLVDGPAPAGPGSAAWDGRDENGNAARPGAYFARLEFEGRTLARTLVRTR